MKKQSLVKLKETKKTSIYTYTNMGFSENSEDIGWSGCRRADMIRMCKVERKK